MKTKTKKYGDKVFSNFRGLNVPEDDTECEFFAVFSIDSLLVQDKKYCQVKLDNCCHKNVNKQMTDYLDENLFEDQILQMLHYDKTDISKGIDLAKSNNSKERMIHHYCFFNHGFEVQDSVCNVKW